MPRLSARTWNRRRRHVLESAWGRFSRDGFHATSMDEVIAATGMSSNAVYRYVGSKDELIDATVEEAFASVDALFEAVLVEPLPRPADIVGRLVRTVRDRHDHEGYDLSRLAMQAWTEALRREHLHARLQEYYGSVHRRFADLAQRWIEVGLVDPGTDPAAVASLLTTLMPGLVVMENLVGEVRAADLLAGCLALGRDAARTGTGA